MVCLSLNVIASWRKLKLTIIYYIFGLEPLQITSESQMTRDDLRSSEFMISEFLDSNYATLCLPEDELRSITQVAPTILAMMQILNALGHHPECTVKMRRAQHCLCVLTITIVALHLRPPPPPSPAGSLASSRFIVPRRLENVSALSSCRFLSSSRR